MVPFKLKDAWTTVYECNEAHGMVAVCPPPLSGCTTDPCSSATCRRGWPARTSPTTCPVWRRRWRSPTTWPSSACPLPASDPATPPTSSTTSTGCGLNTHTHVTYNTPSDTHTHARMQCSNISCLHQYPIIILSLSATQNYVDVEMSCELTMQCVCAFPLCRS